MSSRRKAMLLLATNNKWLPYSYEYLLNSLVPTTIDNRNVLNQAKIIKLYGNGCVVNNKVKNGNFESTSNWFVQNGSLTVSNNVCSFTQTNLSGYTRLTQRMADSKSISGHKYLIRFQVRHNANKNIEILHNFGFNTNKMIVSPNTWTTFEVVYTSNINNDEYFTISFINGTDTYHVDTQITVDVKIVVLVDLSQMFGLGNEPTSINDNRIQAILKRGYIPYNTGEYVGTDISEIVSYDTNNNLLATIPFKEQLNGAINSHDTLEITNTAYVFEKNINRVDLGTLNYGYNSSSLFFQALNFSGFKTFSWNETANILCGNYTTATSDDVELGTKGDLVIGLSKTLKFRDTQYTNATDFKNAISGIYLYYQLSTPQSISIPRKHLGILPLSQVAESSFYPATSTNQRSEVIASGLPNCVAIADNQTPNAYMKYYNVGSPNGTYTFTNGIFTVKQYDSNRIDFYICDNNIVGMTKAQMKEYLSNYLVFYETQDEVDDIVDKIGIEAGGSLSATYNTLALLNLDTKMKCK